MGLFVGTRSINFFILVHITHSSSRSRMALSPAMVTRAKKRHVNTCQEFVSGNDVDKAVEEYVKFILDMRFRSTHDCNIDLCLDQHRNQVKGCNCVFELYRKKKNRNSLDRFTYAVLCNEMATWFSAAKESERTRSLPDTWMSQLMFNKLFQRLGF